mmetsp:Transcript_93963/g.137217  ORF Transcript_93963/g.137217 Transcript_93963/m.137217 type:complete len:141 (+) Transcript_93963:2596-3018(+)
MRSLSFAPRQEHASRSPLPLLLNECCVGGWCAVVWSLVSSLCFSLRSPVKRLHRVSRVKKSLFLRGASVFFFRLYSLFGGFLVAVGYAASLVGGARLSLHHLLWCPLILSSPAAATAPWRAGTGDTINMTDCYERNKNLS